MSHYMLKPVAYNIAYAGSKDQIEAALHYRNQWTALTNRTLSNASFEFVYPIMKINSALAITGIYDVIGAQRTFYLNVGYAYQLKIKKAKLGFGISGGLIQTTLLGNLLRSPEGDYDGVFNHNDPIIPLNTKNGIAPYLTAGLFFSNKNLQLGGSITNAIEAKANVGAPNSSKNIIFRRNIYGFVSYKLKVSNKISFYPSVLLRADAKKLQLDYTLLMNLKNNYFLGIGYRGYNKKSNESVILLLGLNFLKNMQLMYSYDINTSRLFNYQYGSHEVTIKYSFLKEIKKIEPKIIYNPRFL